MTHEFFKDDNGKTVAGQFTFPKVEKVKKAEETRSRVLALDFYKKLQEDN